MVSFLDENTVRHVAHLARLKVTEEEVARFTGQLSAILQYMEQLNQVDTANVDPTVHALPVINVFRDDTVRQSWTKDRALRNSPHTQGDFFRVPKVLDQEGA